MTDVITVTGCGTMTVPMLKGKTRMTKQNDGYVHGVARYRQYGCRCDDCVAAYAGYRAKLRKYPEQSFTIDAEPLIRFIEKNDGVVKPSTQQTFVRWRDKGVDIFVADQHCVKRGVHPFEVYGSDWFEFGEVQDADCG